MPESTCTVDQCAKPSAARAMCKTHYTRFIRNGTLEYVRPPRDTSTDTADAKTCTGCGQSKQRTEYYTSSRNRDGKRAQCKACDNAQNTNGYRANRAEVLTRQRERQATPEYRQWIAQYRADYYDTNRAAFAERAAQRRARIQNAHVDHGITVSALRAKHGDRCTFCSVPMTFDRDKRKYLPTRATLEHMTPLARGGMHTWDNVRLSCHSCNVSKNIKTAAEFRTYLARL